MNILIPTEPDDTHAILVMLALQKMGHAVELVFLADLPTKQQHSVFINQSNPVWKSEPNHPAILNQADVVWWRRPRLPVIFKKNIHPNDRAFLIRENRAFWESLTYTMAPNAFWINPKIAAHRAQCKLFQLKTARALGFETPITLCSNDAADIQTFLLQHEKSGVIYKPLSPPFWFEEDHVKLLYTTKVHPEMLPSRELLALTPGLFQVEIKKQYELRITCFGSHLVAVKINSQSHESGMLDWRAMPENTLSIEPWSIPDTLKYKILRFMRAMGLCFGSLDFIITPNNECIFLEVNEQGQFLWIEEYLPDHHMLDIFVQFITHRTTMFTWDPRTASHTMDTYYDEMRQRLLQNLKQHVELNSEKTQNQYYT